MLSAIVTRTYCNEALERLLRVLDMAELSGSDTLYDTTIKQSWRVYHLSESSVGQPASELLAAFLEVDTLCGWAGLTFSHPLWTLFKPTTRAVN